MFDSPHPPRVFERLLDSAQTAAIIKVHPKTSSATRATA